MKSEVFFPMTSCPPSSWTTCPLFLCHLCTPPPLPLTRSIIHALIISESESQASFHCSLRTRRSPSLPHHQKFSVHQTINYKRRHSGRSEWKKWRSSILKLKYPVLQGTWKSEQNPNTIKTSSSGGLYLEQGLLLLNIKRLQTVARGEAFRITVNQRRVAQCITWPICNPLHLLFFQVNMKGQQGAISASSSMFISCTIGQVCVWGGDF